MDEPRDDRGIWAKAAIAIPLVVLGGMASGWLSNSGMDNGWYARLAKPSFQPPSWAFGVVWTGLYALMGLAVATIWDAPDSRQRTIALRLFFAQLAVNYAWSPIFFGAGMMEIALVVLAVLLVLALATAKYFRNLRSDAGWLLLPYLLWLCLAVTLNYETVRLNPGADSAPLGIVGD